VTKYGVLFAHMSPPLGGKKHRTTSVGQKSL